MNEDELNEIANNLNGEYVKISTIREVHESNEGIKALFHEPWLYSGIIYAEKYKN